MAELDLTKPKAIIFDWDNTIVDVWGAMHGAMNTTLEHMGRESWSLEQAKERIAHSLKDTFPEMFGEKWKEAGEIYRKAYYEQRSGLALMPVADVLVDWLHLETDITLCVVSNKFGPTLREEVESLGWTPYFFSIVGSQDAEADKPNKAPVLFALEGSDIEPGPDVWFVGDSVADIECAHASGCTPILYGDRDPSESAFKRYPPKVVAKTHQQLLDLLFKLC